jgi:translation initiation factor 4A
MATPENIPELKIEDVERFDSFDAMKLSDEILRGIYSYGFEKPSAIQQLAIIPIISGKDIIGQAQSGTGKTGTFTIAALQLIDFKILEPQVLAISPTRELAVQTNEVFNNIGSFCDIKTSCLIGGGNVQSDHEILRRGCHAVIGTPGRIYHMINDKKLKLNNIKLLIVDEADVMLEKGFKDQLYEIFKMGFPNTMQVALFSATLTDQTYEIANKFMRNPLKIAIKKDEVNLVGIQQYKIILQKDEHKFSTLIDLYKFISIKQAIIYCNNKNRTIALAAELNDLKLSMTFIHGDMEPNERKLIMKEFKEGKYRILISTDLLARGIDIQQISLVINYDFPTNRENYIHRIGRTGRYGRKGIALSFVTERDESQIKEVETYYDIRINELPEDINAVFTV